MATAKAVTKNTRSVRFRFRYQVMLMSVLAGLLLVVANSAIWINHNIFNTQAFTTTAVNSLTSESSRQAFATEIVDRALAERPVLKRVAGNTATKLVSGLLGTDQFNQVLETTVGKVQVYVTSKEQKSVAVDISGIKNTIGTLLVVADNSGLADTDQASDRVTNLPNELTLVDEQNIPSFYTYGLVFLWLAPICGLLAVGLLVYPYIRRPSRYYRIAVVQGVAVAGAGLLSLLVGPLFRPPALSSVTSPNMRIVVGNLYDAFIATFNQQAMYLVIIGVLLAVLPISVHYGYQWYSKRK